VGPFERENVPFGKDGGAVLMAPSIQSWTPPAPAAVFPAVFPETFEVRILSTVTGSRLVAAIELISPGTKNRLIPVDFEATYTEACRRKRLTGS
jgi:hypothetical protein